MCNRVGMASYLPELRNSLFFEKGFHATSICGALGAAVTAGLLRGLDADGIVAAMGIAGFVAYGVTSGFGPAVTLFGTETATALGNLDLAAIPLFLLMGSFASIAGLSADVYHLAHALLGHKRGGLAFSTIWGCAGFGAVCGSSVATAAAIVRE